MVAESGAELLEPSAPGALVELLLPRVTVVTPNLPEARALAEVATGSRHCRRPPTSWTVALARAVHALGPAARSWSPAGTASRRSTCSSTASRLEEIAGVRHPNGAAHGSGCTHSSVLAARLAWGDDPLAAARVAKRLASAAVRDGLTRDRRGPRARRRPGDQGAGDAPSTAIGRWAGPQRGFDIILRCASCG